MTFIHQTAIVSKKAEIGADCYIGAFCIVADEVKLGDRVRLDSHVVVEGKTSIGDETHIFPFVSIGLAPQDLKYSGEPTAVKIGKRNHIREFVTIRRGTEGGGGRGPAAGPGARFRPRTSREDRPGLREGTGSRGENRPDSSGRAVVSRSP